MSVTQIENHVDLSRSRLLEQYKNKSNIDSILLSLVNQIQDIEDSLFGMYNRIDVDSSVGYQLDRIGSIVGASRNGLSDDEYKVILFGQIGANTSNGTIEDIVNIFSLMALFSSSDICLIIENFPAAYSIQSSVEISESLIGFVFEKIKSASPTGVAIDSVAYFDLSDESFTFSNLSDTTILIGNPGGFSSTSSPTEGGGFSKILISR